MLSDGTATTAPSSWLRVAELLTEPAITPVSAARAAGINWGAMEPRHRPTESIRRRNETEAIEHRGRVFMS